MGSMLPLNISCTLHRRLLSSFLDCLLHTLTLLTSITLDCLLQAPGGDGTFHALVVHASSPLHRCCAGSQCRGDIPDHEIARPVVAFEGKPASRVSSCIDTQLRLFARRTP